MSLNAREQGLWQMEPRKVMAKRQRWVGEFLREKKIWEFIDWSSHFRPVYRHIEVGSGLLHRALEYACTKCTDYMYIYSIYNKYIFNIYMLWLMDWWVAWIYILNKYSTYMYFAYFQRILEFNISWNPPLCF